MVEAKDISGTSYTVAYSVKSGYTSMACWGKKMDRVAEKRPKTTA